MNPYREVIPCRVCETRVTIAASTKGEDSVKAIKAKLTILCPICEATLALRTPSDIDPATVEVVGFECKGDSSRPRHVARPRPRSRPQDDVLA